MKDAYTEITDKFLEELRQKVSVNSETAKRVRQNYKEFLVKKHMPPTRKGKGFSAQSKIERWKASEEGQYMKKRCLKQYYDTLQEIAGS